MLNLETRVPWSQTAGMNPKHQQGRSNRPGYSVCLSVILVCLVLPGAACAADYAVGADLSFRKQAEERGTLLKDDGVAKPGLRIFKDHGCNWIRLRLFHTPTRLPNNLEYTIALAKE